MRREKGRDGEGERGAPSIPFDVRRGEFGNRTGRVWDYGVLASRLTSAGEIHRCVAQRQERELAPRKEHEGLEVAEGILSSPGHLETIRNII